MTAVARFLSRCCLALIIAVSGSGCASWPKAWGGHPCCIEQKPVVHRQPVWWHLFDMTVLDPLAQPFRIVRPLRKLFGIPVRSYNLHEGQVADTVFFINRSPAALSAEAVRWGPTRPEDLPVGPFTVTQAKAEGKTPGFFVTDSRGVRYLFKLDPVDAPELLSAAEVITSKLMFALGYRVPSYEVFRVNPKDIQVAANATAKLGKRSVPFTREDLDKLFAGRVQEGAVRVCASRIVDGEILGPARLKRFRDCTDMRALKLAFAWVNNVDAKDHNTLLVWDGKRTVGYLLDFGTALGADAGLAGPKNRCSGWEYDFDLKEVSLEIATLGLHRPACDASKQPSDEHVGFFSPNLDPDHWKPYAPNRPFKEMNDADARWMAKRLAQFSRAQIEAAVSAGQYSHSGDASYLADVLEQRRQAIVERYAKEDP